MPAARISINTSPDCGHGSAISCAINGAPWRIRRIARNAPQSCHVRADQRQTADARRVCHSRHVARHDGAHRRGGGSRNRRDRLSRSWSFAVDRCPAQRLHDPRRHGTCGSVDNAFRQAVRLILCIIFRTIFHRCDGRSSRPILSSRDASISSPRERNRRMTIDRRTFITITGLGAAGALLARQTAQTQSAAPFELEEITLGELQEGLRSGRFTSRSLTEAYLARIDAIDKRGAAINALIELNPDALAIAAEMDNVGRASARPLHGIPVLIKDNIDTADRMHTSAGSLALADSIASGDSAVARKLREAGA